MTDGKSMRTLPAIAAAILLCTSARAEAGNPHLAEARTYVERGELEEARAALDRAMAHPQNTNRELTEIYATLAVVHLYAGAENLAYEAYARLLNIDPRYELPPHTAAPLRDLFERVARAYDEGHLRAVRVAHDPPDSLPVGVPPMITATISNMSGDFSAVLRFRRQGEEEFRSSALSARPGNRWVGTLPTVDPVELSEGQMVMEYYLEVVNEVGHRVQGSGNARNPHTLLITPGVAPGDGTEEPDSYWYQSPWVWGAVGGVALGSAAAVYLGVRSGAAGTLPVRVRIREEL